MEPNNNTEVSPDELKADQEALKEAKEDEVRTAIITEYGFDEVDDAERVDKLLKERMSFHETKKSLTKQKVNWRDKATKPNEPAKPSAEAKNAEVDIDKKLDERLAERDLAEIDVPDMLKNEIRDWAKFKGISVKQAKSAPHIAQQIADYEKQQNAEEAAISRTNRSSSGKKNYSLDAPPNSDMSTAEGQKEYEEWKQWARKQ